MTTFDLDKWHEIYLSLKKHKLRTFLTGFGVAWGIFMLVILLGAGQGLEKGILSNFSGYATNTIQVYGGVTSMPYKGLGTGRLIRPTSRDLELLKDYIKDIKYLSLRMPLALSGNVTYKDEEVSASVEGITHDFFKIETFDVKAGRLLNEMDSKYQRKVAIIGKRTLEVLFDFKNPIGEYIIIGDEFFKIVGVFDNESSGFANYESNIFIPATTLRQTYSQADEVQRFSLIPQAGVSASVVEDKIRKFLSMKNQFDSEDKSALWIMNLEERFNNFNSLFSGISIFLWAVGLGTLLGGIVGVGNIMFIAVKERTKEIGIRKALGATPNAIITQILSEAIVITLGAGLVGMLLGSGILFGLGYIMDQMPDSGFSFFTDPQIDLGITISALFVLIVFGLIAGWIPAQKASKVNPIEALRYE